MGHTVRVSINQQQAEFLDRLIQKGELGQSYAEVMKQGFRRYCDEHPEAREEQDGVPVERHGTSPSGQHAASAPSDPAERTRP